MPTLYRCLLCDEENRKPESPCNRDDCGYKSGRWEQLDVDEEHYARFVEGERLREERITSFALVAVVLLILFLLYSWIT